MKYYLIIGGIIVFIAISLHRVIEIFKDLNSDKD
jgi:hypothetical protein